MGVPGLAPIQSYDADQDRTVTQQEIGAGRTERFAAADANGDDALSAEELLAMEEAIREEVRLARAAEAVARMDDNGDGLLQTEEMDARMPPLAPIFDELDTDGDGGISQLELEAGRPGRDGDGDGVRHGRHSHEGGLRGERGGLMDRLFGE